MLIGGGDLVGGVLLSQARFGEAGKRGLISLISNNAVEKENERLADWRSRLL